MEVKLELFVMQVSQLLLRAYSIDIFIQLYIPCYVWRCDFYFWSRTRKPGFHMIADHRHANFKQFGDSQFAGVIWISDPCAEWISGYLTLVTSWAISV